MGFGGLMSNYKKSKQAKNYRHAGKQKKAAKRKDGRPVGEIVDIELTTRDHLRKRRTSPRANITLSGKKKRKLVKQLKRMQADQAKMEDEPETSGSAEPAVRDIEMANPAGSRSTSKAKASSSKSHNTTDVDMEEVECLQSD